MPQTFITDDVDGVFVLDASLSMSWGANKDRTGRSRWSEGEKLMTIVADEVGQVDDDGLTVYVYNNSMERVDGVTADVVSDFFRKRSPNGGTILAPALRDINQRFLPANKKTGLFSGGGYVKVTPVKPVCVILFGDGAPSDKQAVADAIIDSTKRTTRGNIGYLFVQVGYDDEATDFLKWLDTGLRGAEYDCFARVRLEEIQGKSTRDLITMAFNGQ